MRIRIHNPVYGVPIGILDKIDNIYILNNEVISGGGTIDRMSEQSQGHDDKGDWKIRKDIDLSQGY